MRRREIEDLRFLRLFISVFLGTECRRVHDVERREMVRGVHTMRPKLLLIGKYYIGLSQEALARICRMKRGTVAAVISRAAVWSPS